MGISKIIFNIAKACPKILRSRPVIKSSVLSEMIEKGALKYSPLACDSFEFSGKVAKAAETAVGKINLGEKSVALLERPKSFREIVENVIIDGQEYYINAEGKLVLQEASLAQKGTLDSFLQNMRHQKEIHLMDMKEFEKNMAEINFYNEISTSNAIPQKILNSRKGQGLNEILSKAPNITCDDIIEKFYQNVPIEYRPKEEELKKIVNILNDPRYAVGKEQSPMLERLKKQLQQTEDQINTRIKKVEINRQKYSDIKKCDDGNYELFTTSPLEPEKGQIDLIRITAKDKEAFENLIKEKYSDLVDSGDIHSMHRLLQRFGEATKDATDINFEQLKMFLDKLKDIKANPKKYKILSGIPKWEEGDIRIGMHLIKGETSRGGCALAIPSETENIYDMVIFNKEGKIITSISGVKQEKINECFVPITV